MKQVTINAKGRKLGRLASEIAFKLQGKDDPSYNPRLSGDTQILVENVAEMEISGGKEEQKTYYRHTTRIGRLKKRTYAQLFEQDPGRVLRMAVRRMLPKNKLRRKRLTNLIVK